jgi:hypothetical protein|tara:strand:- start:897 stop:1070 length:174 start_codon:yes stop_codon:yes gene_type:complete
MTAVEWLIEKFNITNVDLSHHKLIIEQAKEMEKEQMEKLKDFDTWKEWKNTGIIKSE